MYVQRIINDAPLCMLYHYVQYGTLLLCVAHAMWCTCVGLQVSAWISEKMQVATDESYRDPTNLSGKLKKHQAFEAELTANKNTSDAVCSVSHFAC